MKILLIDNGTSYLRELELLLKDYKFDVFPYHNIPVDTESYGAIVLSGGHKLLINDENRKYLAAEIRLIETSNLPILGICYGFELIAYTYGCRLVKKHREKGPRDITKILDHSIFAGLQELSVYQNHQYYVDKLNSDLIALAESDKGYEIIKHKDKLQFGFQFHPEMVEGTSGQGLFKNWLKIINNT